MSLIEVPPGMKIAAQVSPEASQADLQLVRQMGVDYAVVWTNGEKASYEYYASRKKIFAEAGLKEGRRSLHSSRNEIFSRTARYSAMYRPACRINQTGVTSVGLRRQVFINGLSYQGACGSKVELVGPDKTEWI